MSRALRWATASALVAVLGCSSSSSGTASTTTTTGATATTTVEQLAVKFAECIRTHGVPHFPDANADGEFVFGIDVGPDVWGRAVDACKDLEPPGALSAERSPQQQSAGLRFAQCVRDNGVADFPDPVNGEPLIDTTKIPSSNREGGMAILDGAIATCRDLLDEAARNQ